MNTLLTPAESMFNPFTRLISNYTSSCICAILSSSTGKHTHTRSSSCSESATIRAGQEIKLCFAAFVCGAVVFAMEGAGFDGTSSFSLQTPGSTSPTRKQGKETTFTVSGAITLTAPQTHCGFWRPK